MKNFSQANESMMMFNADLACRNSAVKNADDCEILLMY